MTRRTKVLLLFVLFLSSAFFAGCQTIKEASQGASEGFKKDWQAITGADEKMREVLW